MRKKQPAVFLYCLHFGILSLAGGKRTKKSVFSYRYLLHIFMEAGCLDWCIIIGLILRESSVINQVFSIMQSSDIDGEICQNIKTGLNAVDKWASTDW